MVLGHRIYFREASFRFVSIAASAQALITLTLTPLLGLLPRVSSSLLYKPIMHFLTQLSCRVVFVKFRR
jgi:hypothetical protein